MPVAAQACAVIGGGEPRYLARSLGEQGADGRTALAWCWVLTRRAPRRPGRRISRSTVHPAHRNVLAVQPDPEPVP